MKKFCEPKTKGKSGTWGNAVDYTYKKDGELWVGNSEYENTVDYCPFCGKSATDHD